MAPFFSRITGKDRSGSPSKGSAVSTPDNVSANGSVSGTASARNSMSAAAPPPRMLINGDYEDADDDDTTPAAAVSRTVASPYGTSTSTTTGSVDRKPPPPALSTPSRVPTFQLDSEPLDVMTPRPTSNMHPPPGLVVESAEDTSPISEFGVRDIPSRNSSLGSLNLRTRASDASLKIENGGSRSRRGSQASSDAGSTHRSNTQSTVTPSSQMGLGAGTAATAGVGVNSSTMLGRSPSIPTSGFLSAPSKDSDSVSIVSTSGRKKRLWSKSRGGPGPGGIAGALAHSGMSLAYSGAGLSGTVPASPPLSAQGSPPRRVNSRSGGHVPRTSIDSVLQPRRGSVTSHPRTSEDHESPVDEFDEMYESPDALSFDEDDMPVTGFAVASSKRNADFHELFPDVEEGDYLIEDYGCALQRDILVQGRLYISENHLCFHANIFGWVTNVSIAFADVISVEKKMTAFVIPNAIQIATRKAKYTFASFITRDTSYDVIVNIWRLAYPRRNTIDEGSPDSLEVNPATSPESPENAGANKHKATECACGKKGEHYDAVMMDCVMPGTPQQIHTLMWTSGFIRDFMVNNQKLTEVQTSDWAPQAAGSHLLARTLSYIKPLNNSLGPRSTKCEITDEMTYADFDDYVSIMTITRTPNVPSGGAFSVKTRTCLMWAGPASTRIKVTSFIEWTGRSYIKSMIEKGAMEGQRSWHVDLELAMRAYINNHKSEFFPAGEEVPEIEASLETPVAANGPAEPMTVEDIRKAKQRETEAKGLQWALDTFNGTWDVAVQSAKGAIDLLGDMIEFSSTTSILVVVVVVLVISNLWTMNSLKSVQKQQAQHRYQMRVNEGIWPYPPPASPPHGPQADADALRALLESVINRGAAGGASNAPPTGIAAGTPALPPLEELHDIQTALASLQERVAHLAERCVQDS